jgi:GWxTD domain-containing protein
MRRIIWYILLLTLAADVYGIDEREDRLSPEHKKWLQEEVVYIITDDEKDLFLDLETLEERTAFIEAFWNKRDPNPATPINEFKEEHYRRFDYANEFLGRETFRPGWRTDRGRYYIILGEPREIQRFDGYNEIVPVHLWFFQGDTAKGLPAFFYLMFFKRDDVGEYELYHPVVDGPNALVRGQYSYEANIEVVLEKLTDVSPELARASLSYDTSEPPDMTGGRPSLGTGIMLARVEESPKRAIRTDYADAWRRYGDKVSAEYSFNFVPSRNIFSVLIGPEQTPFVHYSIEIDPQNFTMETDEDRSKFYTTLDVSFEVSNSEGRLIIANDKEVYIELSPSQAQQVGPAPFSYQDDFPLLAGDYKVSVILRNRVIKQYTVAERDITVPSFSADTPTLSDVIVGFRTELKGGDLEPDELRTFQIGNLQVHPSAESVFVLGDTAHVFLQVIGAEPSYGLHFTLMNGEEVLQERTTKVEDYQGGPVVERFPLTGMMGGRYEMRVRLLDPSGNGVAERSSPVTVSPRSMIARPWSYRSSFNTRTPGLLALARGDQLWHLERHAEAEKEFERAVAESQGKFPLARWKLGEAYIRSEKPDKAMEMLAPLEADFANQYEVIAGLGYAHYLKADFEKAADYLSRAMQIRPADATLLNALGESFIKTGELEKAKEALERSLAMDPDQEVTKELLSQLEQAGKTEQRK